MPYRVINVEDGTFVRSYMTELPYEFATGDQAQQFSKQLADDTGQKYRVKKVLNADWRKREQRKCDDGTYEPLPWVCDQWWNDPKAIAIWRYQYAHPSRKEPGMVAYTESEEKGMDNIVTRCKPGRYLEQFRDILKVYGADLQRTAARFTVIYEPRKLMIAATEDEIQWVYENGPPSCMSSQAYRAEHGWGYGAKGKWPLNKHACRTYAAGDLQVAYIVGDEDNPKKARGVMARAVIWPEKKTHSRVYGEELPLKKVLEQEGYSFNPPLGAKLQRHVVDTYHFLCPYIDGGHASGQGSLGVLDKGDHLEIVPNHTPGSHCANSTSGCSGQAIGPDGREAVPRTCQCCAGSPLFDTAQVFTSGTDYRWWCTACRARYSARCGFDGRYYDTRHMTFVEMHNGAQWSQRAFNSRGFTCQATNLRFPREHMVKLEDGALWNAGYAAENAFRCEYTGAWARNEDKVEVKTAKGKTLKFAKKVAGMYCFVCAVCAGRCYDPTKYNGDTSKQGPFVCAACQIGKNPPGTAAKQVLDETDENIRYCIGPSGKLVLMQEYARVYGITPSIHYSMRQLRDVLSGSQYAEFVANGPEELIAEGAYVVGATAGGPMGAANRMTPYAVWHTEEPQLVTQAGWRSLQDQYPGVYPAAIPTAQMQAYNQADVAANYPTPPPAPQSAAPPAQRAPRSYERELIEEMQRLREDMEPTRRSR